MFELALNARRPDIRPSGWAAISRGYSHLCDALSARRIVIDEEKTLNRELHLWHEEGPVAGQASPRLEEIGKPLAFAVAGHHRHAVLILDAYGIVRFATTRWLFGWADEDLAECQLQSLIPTMPVRQGTPGYNVAYVRLAFADQGWQCHRALAADGTEFPVELSVRPLPIGRSYALLAAVREVDTVHAGRAAMAYGSVSPFGQSLAAA